MHKKPYQFLSQCTGSSRVR